MNFYDPDTNVTYTVHTENMVWENRHGYVALGVKEGDKPEDPAEPFQLVLLFNMIKETYDQSDGVELAKEPPQDNTEYSKHCKRIFCNLLVNEYVATSMSNTTCPQMKQRRDMRSMSW